MSIFDSSCLDVIRRTLSRFYCEITAFRTNQPEEFSEGSQAASECEKSQRPESLVTGWSIASMLIESGGEHMTTFVKTITAPMEPIACFTCIRSMLESCALAAWLLDPGIDASTRIGRVFAHRYAGLEQRRKFVSVGSNNDEELCRVKMRISAVERDAINLGYDRIEDKNSNRIGIGQKMPTATQLIGSVLDQEEMYRLLSAVVHGHAWAIQMLSYSRETDASVPIFSFGVDTHLIEKCIDVDTQMSLAITAVMTFAKPIWYRYNYAGWDNGNLIELLEKTSDQLQVNESERFWRF